METLTHPIILFWICFLLHLLADFNLQGILADMKQERWWNKQIDKLLSAGRIPRHFHPYRYKDDYLVALWIHALMWSIITFGMLALIVSPIALSIIILVNAAIHAIIDDCKANMYLINLEQDQIMHLVQVAVTVGLTTLIAK